VLFVATQRPEFGLALRREPSLLPEKRCPKGELLHGEVLDLDGPIGGYNFQAAFSTGWLAGEKAASDALKQWQYSPLVLNGIPTPFVLTVTFTFSASR
jgi:hypothetical protein